MSQSTQPNNIPNKYQGNLFKSVRPPDGLGADVLVPGTADNSDYVTDSNQQSKLVTKQQSSIIIDVHGAFPWTLSPAIARATTPVIEITEYKQVLSSELMGYAYAIAGTVDNFNVAGRTLPTATAATAGVVKQATTVLSNTIPGVGSVLDKTFGNVAKFLGNTVINTGFVAGTERLQEMRGPAKEASDKDSIKNDANNTLLDPYRGLYAVEPTGFIYRLPYKQEANFNQTNGWGDPENYAAKALGSTLDMLVGDSASSSGGGAGATPATPAAPGASTGEGAGSNVIGKAGSILDIVKGVMTSTGGVIKAEKPQSYQGPQSKDTINVKFILYNTVRFEDIKRNWELCFLLSYQNLPNRKGINLMDPPKLYRLLIPGYKQFPMCWVSNISIKNLGSVRMIDIDDPDNVFAGNSLAVSYTPSVKLIPEAYEIDITFEHAFYSSQNLFAYALQPSSVVTTTVNLTEALQRTAPQPTPPPQG